MPHPVYLNHSPGDAPRRLSGLLVLFHFPFLEEEAHPISTRPVRPVNQLVLRRRTARRTCIWDLVPFLFLAPA